MTVYKNPTFLLRQPVSPLYPLPPVASLTHGPPVSPRPLRKLPNILVLAPTPNLISDIQIRSFKVCPREVPRKHQALGALSL